jgi:NAD(P)-dependent dehydrogenase (short-subunit alcohol dehydrogenase family)
MKNIIILGANEGIGYYLAKKLLENGNNVGIFDISLNNLNELKSLYSNQLLTIECDAKSNEDIEKAVAEFVKKFKKVDIAIHNACKCTFDSMENTDEEIYKEVFDINYFGALRLTRNVVDYMKETGGRIIYTSSGVGVMGFTKISPYASSKGAIESLAKCMNIEYKKYGITFHIFHPPLTKTKSASPLPVPKEFMADPEKVGYGLAKHINKKSFVICHNFSQTMQTKMSYLIPLKLGALMSKMTDAYEKESQNQNEDSQIKVLKKK